MIPYQCKSPVLFLVFNRPDVTKRVFEAIRQARPSKLYVAADGPRLGRQGEVECCQQVREIATAVDWDCEVKTYFRDKNLGCGKAVSLAITWFFENVEEGIILEDDCLPDHSFFRFCDELLVSYRDDDRIQHIGGTNPLNQNVVSSNYYYSKYNRIWGWATWAKSWNHFDLELVNWPALKESDLLYECFGAEEADYWSDVFDTCYAGEIDTWDYQWFLSRLCIGMGIMPGCNLVSNIGFGDGATHTIDPSNVLGKMQTQKIHFPLVKPSSYVPDFKHDSAWGDELISSSKRKLIVRIKRALKKMHYKLRK